MMMVRGVTLLITGILGYGSQKSNKKIFINSFHSVEASQGKYSMNGIIFMWDHLGSRVNPLLYSPEYIP